VSYAPAERRIPSRWGYAVAALILVVATAVATVLGVMGAREISRSLDVVPLAADEQVTIEDGRLAVYSSGTPQLTRCLATPVEGGPPVSFRSPFVDFDVTVNGRQWDQVATSPEGLAPGTYVLSCNLTESAAATAPVGESPTYGTGPVLRFGHVAMLFLVAVAVGGLGVLAALITAVVTAVRRGQAKRPPRPPPYQGPPPPYQGPPTPYRSPPPHHA